MRRLKPDEAASGNHITGDRLPRGALLDKLGARRYRYRYLGRREDSELSKKCAIFSEKFATSAELIFAGGGDFLRAKADHVAR